MSDETTQTTTTAEPAAAPAPAAAPSPASAPAEQPTAESSTPDGTDAPVEKTDKVEIPKKFQKADGSLDDERLVKAYVNLEKSWSKKPNMPAASPDDYSWDKEADLDPERVTEFKNMVHEKGFTKDQYAFIMEQYKQVVESMVWTADRTEEVMKQEWGKDFEANFKAAHAGFEHFAPSDADIDDPVWNHPSVMKLLARLGSEVTEESLTPKTKGTPTAAESLDARIAELRKQPNWHSDAKIQAELDALYAKKYA